MNHNPSTFNLQPYNLNNVFLVIFNPPAERGRRWFSDLVKNEQAVQCPIFADTAGRDNIYNQIKDDHSQKREDDIRVLSVKNNEF